MQRARERERELASERDCEKLRERKRESGACLWIGRRVASSLRAKRVLQEGAGGAAGLASIRQHTSAYVSMRQQTSAYVSIRQDTSAYVSIREHTRAYVSIPGMSHCVAPVAVFT